MTEENPQAEIAEIQEVIRTDPSAYWRDPEKQARLAALTGGGDAGPETAPVVDKAPERNAELEQIRETLRTEPAKYWADKNMQARFEQLLAGPEAEQTNYLGLREFGYARPEIMADERLVDVVKSWGAAADANVKTYYDRAADLFNAEETAPLEAEELRDNFTGLDAEMSPALAKWIVGIRQADFSQQIDLKAAREPFLSTEEGQTLQRIWGGDFDKNLGLYLSRVQALRASMPGHVFDRFMNKFDALSPGAARAVIEWIIRQ